MAAAADGPRRQRMTVYVREKRRAREQSWKIQQEMKKKEDGKGPSDKPTFRR